MIRYKVTTGDNSVQVEFESMVELFQYLAYEKGMADQKELIDAMTAPQWENTID